MLIFFFSAFFFIFFVYEQEEEHYVCIRSTRDYDEILFYHEGGVNVGNVDSKATRLQLKLTESLPLSTDKITKNLQITN